MKRKLAWLALPLVLAALMVGVKWRAEHPTPTQEDLAVRALMFQSPFVEVRLYGSAVPKVSARARQEKIPMGDVKSHVNDFYLGAQLSNTGSPSINAHELVTIEYVVESHVGQLKRRKQPNAFITMDIHNRWGVIRYRLGKRDLQSSNIHPVTVKRWLEMLENHPRFGPELRARRNS